MARFICWQKQDDDAKKAVSEMWTASGGVPSDMNTTHAEDGTPLVPRRKMERGH